MSDQGKLPHLDEESRRMHEELKKKPETQTPVSDAIREAMPDGRATVQIDSVLADISKSRRDFKEMMALSPELKERDDCCLLSLQALLLGTSIVTFKFQCPHSVNLLALRLSYCPHCGKKL